MQTLAARAREMLGTGLRILTAALLVIFFLAYALGAVMLLPLVALVLAVAALPGRLRAAGRELRAVERRLRAAARQLRAAARWLHRAALSMPVHARSALGWWLSPDR